MEAPTRYGWQQYERACRSNDAQWLRQLSVVESLGLYLDLFRLARTQMDDSPGCRRLEAQRWQKKLAVRRRLHEAFSKLDVIQGRQVDDPWLHQMP